MAQIGRKQTDRGKDIDIAAGSRPRESAAMTKSLITDHGACTMVCHVG